MTERGHAANSFDRTASSHTDLIHSESSRTDAAYGSMRLFSGALIKRFSRRRMFDTLHCGAKLG